MNTITLSLKQHKAEERIFIEFPQNKMLNTAVKQIAGIKWSQTFKQWHLPAEKNSVKALQQKINSLAVIDTSILKKQLERKKIAGTGTIAPVRINKEIAVLPSQKMPTGNFLHKPIQPVNVHVISEMEQQLKLKAYSPSTIKTYLNEMAQLLQTLGNIPADELKPEHLKRYLVYCFEKLQLTENTLHSRISAIKFYFEQVLKREKFFWEIPRPKKQLQLPRFFNQNEITAIIKAAGNIKHKTMLMLAYSSGLRVSEVVSIKIKNIDSKRMCILVSQAKGKKDRIVTLSPVLLIMLREYWKKYKPLKNGYLFEGQMNGKPYNSRSLQLVLATAKKKAGVLKPGSVHALRHSFATHLLDRGTDVTMIMKLLGHNDIKTTLRYLHVTNRDMLKIISPLDELNLI